MYLNSALAHEELVNVSRGKACRVPIAVLAAYVLAYCVRGAAPNPVPGTHDDSGRFLRSLYALKDLRPQSLSATGGA
jgi:hypothetical protein